MNVPVFNERGLRPDTAPRHDVMSPAPRLVGAAAPFLAWVVGFAVCALLRRVNTYWSAALWGLLLLASFVTWGGFVTRRLGDRRRFGWGFEACVGMGLSLWVFGALACVHLASTLPIILWSAAGPMLLAVDRARGAAPVRWPSPTSGVRAMLRGSRSPLLTLALALLGVVALIQYAHAVVNASFNP